MQIYNDTALIDQKKTRLSFFRSTNYAAEKCRELNGFYSFSDTACYYNGSRHDLLCRYFVNLKCYAYSDSSYTASTCANIGGFFTTFSTEGETGNFCYYRQFNCTLHAANGQCYRFKAPTNSRSECDANDGYYKHGFCYYECPSSKYLANNVCYNFRSAEYTQNDCETVGGHYANSYCYMSRCDHFPVNSHCYRYRTASYNNGTCSNIGGHYAAEAESINQHYCYYTSFNCRHYAVNGQCYSRSGNQSQTVCESIRDSYYDTNNNACYYSCTEMPRLGGQCIAGASSSFTRGTCAAIGGVYSNHICYYLTSYCPMYKMNNGQCHSNRSDTLTCDTCRNIGGHFENGSCYYDHHNCSRYSIDGQCYSVRAFGMNAAACNVRGGLFHGGYCYYQQSSSLCDVSLYRNCTCFRSSSQYKTVDTCANIGGYYDYRTQRCLYSSSPCPYFNKNRQCYRYKNSDFSLQTCSNIGGYYVRRQHERVYDCYFNEFNCSNWENNQCYSLFSSSYNKGTCASIRGYYSGDAQGCYYNSFSCSYGIGGQCYDRAYAGWSKHECDEASGYWSRGRELCLISNYYCAYLVEIENHRKCSMYKSASYDCNSCRLLDGFLHSGECYHNSENCSEPLLLASNGQCYENRTSVITEAECSSLPGKAFYDEDDNCYFSTGTCNSGHYVNCRCYAHRSTVYTSDSCNNFGGYFTNGRCYYNSSHCPRNYHSVNGQCYRRSDRYSPSTCLNIEGYYQYNSAATDVDVATTERSVSDGTCYYNSFNCSSGFIVDGRHCFMNRSTIYSNATCRTIGGIYGYAEGGNRYRRYWTASESFRSPRPRPTLYCLYNNFSCAG